MSAPGGTASAPAPIETEAESELRERRELLRHLQGHRTQALPKNSLFGTPLELLTKQERSDALAIDPSHPALQAANNKRFERPRESIAQVDDLLLDDLRDEIRREAMKYSKTRRQTRKAEAALDLLESAAKYSVVRGASGGSRSAQSQSKSLQSAVGERERRGKQPQRLVAKQLPGHPSDETLCIANTRQMFTRAPQLLPDRRDPLGSSGSYPNFPSWMDPIYYRRRRRHRVTSNDQYGFLTGEEVEAAYDEADVEGSDEMVVDDASEKRAERLMRELPESVAHKYKHGEMADLLEGSGESANLRSLLAERASRVGRERAPTHAQFNRAAAPTKSAYATIMTPSSHERMSLMKSVHSNLTKHPLADRPPDDYRHTMDSYLKWKEADIVRDRVFKEWDARKEERRAAAAAATGTD